VHFSKNGRIGWADDGRDIVRTLKIFAIATVMVGIGLVGPADGSAGPVAVCDGLPATITGAGVINGTAGPDVIVGSVGNDTIKGNGGNDRIFGELGTDRIAGDAGNDYLDLGGDAAFGVGATASGGTGNDELTGNASTTTCNPTGCTASPVYDGGAGDDTIVANGNVRGGSGNDTLTGSGLVEGGAGDDVLSAPNGGAELRGGLGNDKLSSTFFSQILNGGSGSDSCDELDGDVLISCEQVI
jgi:Ca2+-binding RTX toxin-like protein